MAVLEAQVAADTVERLFDGGQNAGEGRTVLILLVLPVVIIETQADRSVVAGTSWPGSLDGVAAFRVTLQIESLGKANVNIFGTTGGVSRVAPVDHGHRPVKVSVVGRPAEFDAALRRAKNNWIVCRCTRGSEVGLAVNVIRRQINRFRLREGQIQLELSEPHVQRGLRQSDPMAQIAVFQPTVAHGAAGIRGVYRNVVVDPEGKVLAETPSADDREGVGGEQVGTGSESSLGDEACGLLAVQRSEEHTSELQSRLHLVCRLLLEQKKQPATTRPISRRREEARRTRLEPRSRWRCGPGFLRRARRASSAASRRLAGPVGSPGSPIS